MHELDLFSGRDFNYLDDFDANHFHMYMLCIEVLAANFWDLFKDKGNGKSQHFVCLLKYHFCQALAQVLVLEAKEEFCLDLNYEDYIWHDPKTFNAYKLLRSNCVRRIST